MRNRTDEGVEFQVQAPQLFLGPTASDDQDGAGPEGQNGEEPIDDTHPENAALRRQESASQGEEATKHGHVERESQTRI